MSRKTWISNQRVFVKHSYLDTKDSEDDEECAANENDVSDRFQRRKKGLNDQLEAGSTIDHPQRSEGSDESEDAEDSKDFRRLAKNDDHAER